MIIQTSTITQKGQVTVPLAVRKKLLLEPGERVSFIVEDNEVKLSKALDFFSLRGSLQSKKVYNKKRAREEVVKYLVKRHGKIA